MKGFNSSLISGLIQIKDLDYQQRMKKNSLMFCLWIYLIILTPWGVKLNSQTCFFNILLIIYDFKGHRSNDYSFGTYKDMRTYQVLQWHQHRIYQRLLFEQRRRASISLHLIYLKVSSMLACH